MVSPTSQSLLCLFVAFLLEENLPEIFSLFKSSLGNLSSIPSFLHSGGHLLGTLTENTRNYSFSIGELSIDKDSEKRSGLIAELFDEDQRYIWHSYKKVLPLPPCMFWIFSFNSDRSFLHHTSKSLESRTVYAFQIFNMDLYLAQWKSTC